MSTSKHSFTFQHIQNDQLILPIWNRNRQNDHNDRKQTKPKISVDKRALFGWKTFPPRSVRGTVWPYLPLIWCAKLHMRFMVNHKPRGLKWLKEIRPNHTYIYGVAWCRFRILDIFILETSLRNLTLTLTNLVIWIFCLLLFIY